jgi:hypothetical protein
MLVDAMSDQDPTQGIGQLCSCASAKLAMGLAAVALPFARSHSEEAERWFRILRVNGVVGRAMQAIGLPEHPLVLDSHDPATEPSRPDSFERVIAGAQDRARERQATAITTEDLLFGVRMTYGAAFENALAIRGTTSEELLDRIERCRDVTAGGSGG